MKGPILRRDINWPSVRRSNPLTETIGTSRGDLTIKLTKVTTTLKSITVRKQQTFTLTGVFRHKDSLTSASGNPQVEFELELSVPNVEPLIVQFEIFTVNYISGWLNRLDLTIYTDSVHTIVFRLQAELLKPEPPVA